MGIAFWLLSLAQGLFMLNGVVLLSINALVGLELAPRPGLATLPVAVMVVASALSTGLVARSQLHLGRRRAFQLGLLAGTLAYALCALAAQRHSFTLLLLGSALAGYAGANASLYRFAAAELVPAPLRERALSLVLVGGLLGAFVGPGLAHATRDLFALPYVGAYAACSLLAFLSIGLLAFIRFPALAQPTAGHRGRSLGALARQPAYLVAVLAAATGYGVMSLLMNATPIAMQQHHHSFQASAQVLEWHVIAMFAPSLFSGRLIARVGPRAVIRLGTGLMLACVLLALSGVDLMRFFAALVALGLGWNFLYTGASALLLQAYRPEEKTRAQAGMDFVVFTVTAVGSLSSGTLITGPGWSAVNLAALLPLGCLAAVLAWDGARDAPATAIGTA